MLKVLDLFSGIGGFSLGLERTGGFETVAFCEIEEYPQKVLKKHWPDVPIYNDVRELTAEQLKYDGISVDVICGGFPCQDISTAGQQAGIGAETRSGLWSECARLLGELRPEWAVFENVPNLLNGQRGDWFKRVLWDISQVGYDAEWHCIPASYAGAPHRRDRVWIIAHPKKLQRNGGDHYTGEFLEGGSVPESGNRGGSEALADTERRKREMGRLDARTRWITELDAGISRAFWQAEPAVGRVANGVPATMDRLKALGNAVVPQIPELIGRAILEVERSKAA